MTTIEEKPSETPREVGTSRPRKEDQHLVTGRTTWVDNLALPGMLHLAVLRSPMAHARITSVDTDDARRAPGGVAVLTGQALADTQGDLPCAWPVTPDTVNPGAPALAVDQVNFAGDAVAVVAARSHAEAVDALEEIDVDYEPLDPVLDLEEALADGATLVHESAGTNKCFTWALDSAEAGSGGSVDDASRD